MISFSIYRGEGGERRRGFNRGMRIHGGSISVTLAIFFNHGTGSLKTGSDRVRGVAGHRVRVEKVVQYNRSASNYCRS